MPVGASLLAKNSQAPRSFRKHALSLMFFASKLAPTEGNGSVWWRWSLRQGCEHFGLVIQHHHHQQPGRLGLAGIAGFKVS
ncbi:hypothetical protein FW800_17110 [Pseudomonas sp. 910_23]